MPTFEELSQQVLNEIREQNNRIDRLEGKANRPAIGTRNSAADPALMKAFDTYIRTGDFTELRTKEMSIGSNPNGGFAVPKQLADAIQLVAMNFGAIRGIADVRSVGRANWAKIVSITAAGGEWVSETGTRNTTGTPALAEVIPPSGGLSAVAPITRWLLEDAEYDMESFLISEIGRQHGVMEAAAFVTGDGVNKPRGILNYTFAAQADDVRPFATLQKVPSGTSATFTADNLISLLFSLKTAYRARASFVMHPNTLAFVRQLKASTSGVYIWEPAAQAGMPSTLFGANVYEDVNVPPMGAGTLSVLCGDFTAGYQVIDIGTPVLIRDEVTTKGKIALYVEKRVGGAVTDSNAIKALSLEV